MALHARGGQISRRLWLLASLATPLFPARSADLLSVSFDGDNLRVSAPNLHFLTGKPLQRMRDGASVVYLTQLTLFSDRGITVIRRAPVERFVVSYDIWGEDKFSVTMPGRTPRSASSLSASATEAWVLENLAISASGIAPDRPIWLRLEMRTGDQKELSGVLGEPGISLRNLILLLGRKPGVDDPQWVRDAGPLRLVDLNRATPGRGTRSG
jgi:hypothetical protein